MVNCNILPTRRFGSGIKNFHQVAMTLIANATNSPTPATVALIKAKKPAATSLGMAKYPLPTDMFFFLGWKLIFAYPISHLCLLGFTFMFLNINSLYRFGIYSSLMTGNTIDVVLDMLSGDYKLVVFRLTIIFVHSFGGTCLNCYLMEYTKSRENTFALIMLGLVVSSVLVDFMFLDHSTDNHYVVALLCIVTGALAHWCNKLGYTLMLHTGNIFKLSETGFLLLNGYAVGGAKARGDAVLLLCLIVSSLFGAFFAVQVLLHAPRVSCVPVLVTVPLHLHLSGTLAVWGYKVPSLTDCFFGLQEAPSKSDPAENTPPPGASGTTTPVRNTMAGRVTLGTIHERDTEGSNFELEQGGASFGGAESGRNTTATPRGTVAGRGGNRGFSIFERVEMSPDDLKEFQTLMGERANRLNSNIA